MSSPPPHPLTVRMQRLAIGGAAIAAASLVASGLGAPLGVAGIGISVAALLVALWRVSRTTFDGVQNINLAIQHLTRGETSNAEAILDGMQRTGAHRAIARGEAIVRAMIAIDRGQPLEAITQAERAVAHPGTSPQDEVQIALASSLLAFAHAMAGNLSQAERAADATEAILEAPPEVLARARLARAVVLARRGDAALERHLRDNAHLVLDHAFPRERALFRAMLRMTRARKHGVYREPSPPGDRTPGKLASWVGLVAPDAAAYVDPTDEDAPIALLPMPLSTPEAIVRVDVARRRAAGKAPSGITWKMTAGLWLVLVGLLFVVWKMVSVSDVETTYRVSAAAPIVAAGAFFTVFAAFVLVIAGRTRMQRRREREILRARREAFVGDPNAAEARLESIANNSDPLVAATARLELARLAMKRSEFTKAMAHCDAGIGRVNAQPHRARASDIVLPSLLMESAVANAARGRLEESRAELTLLRRDFRAFALLAIAEARVRVVCALRAKDLEEAERVARSRTAELWLPREEDMLCDLLVATSTSNEEREGLRAELDADVRLAAWIDAVAPGLRERALAGRGQPHVRVALASVREEPASEPSMSGAERREEAAGGSGGSAA